MVELRLPRPAPAAPAEPKASREAPRGMFDLVTRAVLTMTRFMEKPMQVRLSALRRRPARRARWW